MSRSLTGEVRLVVKDRYDEVVDTHMPIKGFQTFRWWYGYKKSSFPNNNVWQYDLGKLVMPTIFKDVDLLLELVARYDEITHEVKNINGNVFLRIDANSIR